MRDLKVSQLSAIIAKCEVRWPVYIPALLVALFFGMWATEDAGPIGTLPYVAVAGLCIVQMLYPTWAVWSVLVFVFTAYAVTVAVTPRGGTTGEQLVFFLFGAVPALFLLVSRPKPTTTEMKP